MGTICPLKYRAHLGEGGARAHHGDERRLLPKAFTEPGEEGVDELAIVDGIAKFPKFVRDGLEALIVDADRGVALNRIAKLGVESGEASINIVLGKSDPEIGSGGSLTINEIENFCRDPRVDPLYDREIVFDPLGIIGASGGPRNILKPGKTINLRVYDANFYSNTYENTLHRPAGSPGNRDARSAGDWGVELKW